MTDSPGEKALSQKNRLSVDYLSVPTIRRIHDKQKLYGAICTYKNTEEMGGYMAVGRDAPETGVLCSELVEKKENERNIYASPVPKFVHTAMTDPLTRCPYVNIPM